MAIKPTTRKPAAKSTSEQLAEAVIAATPPKPARKRAAKDSNLVLVPGVGTVLPDAKPAAKRAAKPKADAVEPAAVVEPAAAATLADLAAVQAKIDALGLAERRDADDPLMIRRNELINAAIEQGAGFAAIARARGVSTSTNRGLIRVLQGGKRL